MKLIQIESGIMTDHQAHYLILFTFLAATAVLIQAIALGVLAFAGAKLLKQLAKLTEEARGKIYPLMETVHELSGKASHIADLTTDFVKENTPKINHIVDNVSETSDVYRAKVAQVDALMTDTADKAKRQSDRVDGMITDVLARTTEVTGQVQHAIMAPFHQIAGIVGGAKTGIETLIHNFGAKKARPVPQPVAFEGDSIYTGLEDDYHA